LVRNNKTPSIKALLAIVGMRPPISFDTKKYNDNQPDAKYKYDKHIPIDNRDAIITMLKNKLLGTPCDWVNYIISEFNLGKPVLIVMIQLIAYLARHLRYDNVDKMNRFKIGPNIAWIIPEIHDGESLFQVTSSSKGSPNRLQDIVIFLIGKLKKGTGRWPKYLVNVKRPEFPGLTSCLKQKYDQIRTNWVIKQRNTPTNDLRSLVQSSVECILEINGAFLEHAILIEQFYYDESKQIMNIHSALMYFISTMKKK
jgi:hypothetical protein